MNVLSQVTTPLSKAHALITECHVDEGLLTMISTKLVELLALKLILNSLSIRSVANKRQDGTNAFNKQCSLSRFGIIQSGLDTIVAIGIPQKFLETSTIEEFLNEDFASSMLSHTNALE
jgi:hypothetical protein